MGAAAWSGALIRRRRILPLVGPVRDVQCRNLARDLLALSAESTEDILIVIDTTGGSGPAATTLATAITLSNAPVTGLVLTRSMSAGTLVLQSCHHRLALPGSVVQAHYSYLESEQRFQNDRHAAAFEELMAVRRLVQQDVWQAEVALFAERTGLDTGAAAALLHQGAVMLAQEALRVGLLDAIIGERPRHSP